MLFLGVVALARLPLPGNAVLVSLLLALAAAVAICIPIVLETRFALSLHLVLLAATVGIRPQHAWRQWHLSARRYRHAAVVVTCYILWISTAFAMHLIQVRHRQLVITRSIPASVSIVARGLVWRLALVRGAGRGTP